MSSTQGVAQQRTTTARSQRHSRRTVRRVPRQLTALPEDSAQVDLALRRSGREMLGLLRSRPTDDATKVERAGNRSRRARLTSGGSRRRPGDQRFGRRRPTRVPCPARGGRAPTACLGDSTSLDRLKGGGGTVPQGQEKTGLTIDNEAFDSKPPPSLRAGAKRRLRNPRCRRWPNITSFRREMSTCFDRSLQNAENRATVNQAPRGRRGASTPAWSPRNR